MFHDFQISKVKTHVFNVSKIPFMQFVFSLQSFSHFLSRLSSLALLHRSLWRTRTLTQPNIPYMEKKNIIKIKNFILSPIPRPSAALINSLP